MTLEDPEGQLAQAWIDEFLHLHGHDARSAQSLPAKEWARLLKDATAYASEKLSEIEACALLDDADPAKPR